MGVRMRKEKNARVRENESKKGEKISTHADSPVTVQLLPGGRSCGRSRFILAAA